MRKIAYFGLDIIWDWNNQKDAPLYLVRTPSSWHNISAQIAEKDHKFEKILIFAYLNTWIEYQFSASISRA